MENNNLLFILLFISVFIIGYFIPTSIIRLINYIKERRLFTLRKHNIYFDGRDARRSFCSALMEIPIAIGDQETVVYVELNKKETMMFKRGGSEQAFLLEAISSEVLDRLTENVEMVSDPNLQTIIKQLGDTNANG